MGCYYYNGHYVDYDGIPPLPDPDEIEYDETPEEEPEEDDEE